ncbi:MAG TPA: glycosyltransferase family 2 protein [Longimicrobium sp.]|nr:glycosyltransferase family 2 protein [Longimicrobium sp.]
MLDPSTHPVEVALATHNGERYLPALLDSLLAQTHRDFTIVVSDDGSTDATVAVMRGYAERHPGRIRIVATEPRRLGAAGNFSSILPHLTADYVLFCDQDDVWLPRKMELSLARLRALEANAPAGTPILVHTNLAVVGGELEPIAPSAMEYQSIDPARRAFPLLLMSNVATGCTVAVNRALLTLAAPVPPEAMMHDHWFALVAAGLGSIGYIDEPTILYRQHGGNAVGARPWGARTVADKLRETLFTPAPRDVLARHSRQAAVCVARYGGDLRMEDREAATALARVWEVGGWRRFWHLWRNGIRRDGVLRNAALLFTVAAGTPRNAGIAPPHPSEALRAG